MSTQSKSKTPQTRWIWPFELVEQIGEGGMGVVYRARYVVNDRQVALKMIPSDVKDKIVLQRFERELEVLKTLRHPHIVRCFGGVCENKRRFYAMELIEGGTLEDILQTRGRLPWEQVIGYGHQMCAALDASHQKGVIHRDIKPSNFLLTPDGHLKLSDFGLASVIASRKITAAGKTAGTFLYMAPEQIRGKQITPKTDLYALGCVLYELITGEAPFVGTTPAETLHQHCHDVPRRPTEQVLDCPVALERIILKLLEKNPEDRFASPADVSRALGAVKQTIEVVSPRKDIPFTSAGEPSEAPVPVADLPRFVWRAITTGPVIVLALALVMSLIANTAQFHSGSDPQWQRMWFQALDDPQVAVRIAAAKALAEMAERSEEAVRVLAGAMDDDDSEVRLQAVRGLGHAGALARDQLPSLIKIQKNDPSDVVRDTASVSIAEIEKGGDIPRSSSSKWIIGGLICLGLAAAAWYWFQRQSTPTTQMAAMR